MKLFFIYIGGSHEKSFIELHDMRFVAAEIIEDTYEELKRSWWGKPESLHLDAWGCLHYADGHEIHLKNEPPADMENKLFFVNLGGYDKNEFTELHKNVFVVAKDASKAKVKALKQILEWQSYHRDYQFDVEKIINVDSILADKNTYIHLSLNEQSIPFEFTCKFVPLGKSYTAE